MKLTILSTLFFLTTGQLIAQNDLAFNWTPKPTGQTSNFGLTSNNNITSTKEVLVRPFITDDARVVGERLAQLETWIRVDKEAGQHWILGAYGPNKKLELTAASNTAVGMGKVTIGKSQTIPVIWTKSSVILEIESLN